jgi:hypothetical protein
MDRNDSVSFYGVRGQSAAATPLLLDGPRLCRRPAAASFSFSFSSSSIRFMQREIPLTTLENSLRHDLLLRCQTVLPLPKGEGWGEGEEIVRIPHRLKFERPR